MKIYKKLAITDKRNRIACPQETGHRMTNADSTEGPFQQGPVEQETA